MAEIIIPKHHMRLLRNRSSRHQYVSLDDIITWAYKGAFENEDPDIRNLYKAIAEGFEEMRERTTP